MAKAKQVNTPLTVEQVRDLHAGDIVYLSGELLTARDAAHKRLIQELEDRGALPLDLSDRVLYYVGPCPPAAGQVIGAAGPTTSSRMDSHTVPLLQAGLRGMIGKGQRAEYINKALIEYQAVYFLACGGAGALLASCVKSAEVLLYPDLGPESIRLLTVVDMPLVVAADCYGGSVFTRKA